MTEERNARRPLTRQDIALAATAGFVISFTVFFFAILFFPSDILFQAQLLMGGPTAYQSINVLVMNEQFQVATAALGSFWFWIAVMIASIVMSWWLLRSLRS